MASEERESTSSYSFLPGRPIKKPQLPLPAAKSPPSDTLMDSLLCDELLIEILQRLPPSSPLSVSLVSKRWLRLFRLSTTSLSLSLLSPSPHLLSAFLSHYPFLSTLSLSCPPTHEDAVPFDRILLSTATSFPARLHHLRCLGAPILSSSLSFLSSPNYSFSTHLKSLTISLSRPLHFAWLPNFPSLKTLTLLISDGEVGQTHRFNFLPIDDSDNTHLSLETLSVSGICWKDVAMGWLWRSCRALRRLRLRSCEGVGDGGSFSSFSQCLRGVEEVELRACRSIVDEVLFNLAESCSRLGSLLVYDGGSREGLFRFILNCTSDLRRIDLRLPLDLENRHLLAMASRFANLNALRLRSCFLFTGDGLKNLSLAASDVLEELSLINCDVVEKVPGLLTTLGQNLRRLKQLDLSHNEALLDKEFVSMLASCDSLVHLKLRGCKRLTRASVAFLLRGCKHLESIDMMQCDGIEGEAVEVFVMKLPNVRRVEVEHSKVSVAAWDLASNRWIEVITG